MTSKFIQYFSTIIVIDLSIFILCLTNLIQEVMSRCFCTGKNIDSEGVANEFHSMFVHNAHDFSWSFETIPKISVGICDVVYPISL